MRHVATITQKPLAEICTMISWKLYKELGPAKSYDTLRRMVHENNPELVLSICEQLRQESSVVMDALTVAAGRKLTPHEVRVRAVFDLQCFSAEGVLAIKDAVAAVKSEGLTIRVISAPQFLIETSGIGKELCVGRIEEALGKLKQEMETRGGVYKLRSPPDVIGEDEEEIPKFEDEDVSSDDEEEDVERSEGDEDSDSSDSSDSSSSSSEDDSRRKKKGDKKRK
jgi:translation initiation factor 2 alpha subunit (eIF-2alpha)